MYKLVSVDFQREFTSRGYASVDFVTGTLAQFLGERGIRVAEIISDYRQPRPGDTRNICIPGTSGYESEIPVDIREPEQWIKAMNSPLWTRKNAGTADAGPGLPYQDPEELGRWIAENIGSREDTEIILIGLTLDSCVLSAAQEFRWRGFEVSILAEATDPASGDPDEKEYLLKNPPVTNWATAISWDRLKNLI